MPTKRRRIPLLVDETVDAAFGYFRPARSVVADSRLARRAVLEGAALEALLQIAAEGTEEQARARAVLVEMVDLLSASDLPGEVIAELHERVAALAEQQEEEERRQRVLAYLAAPSPHRMRPFAHELAEEFDELDRESS